MKFFNINDPSAQVTLREAVLKSAPGVTGLFLPVSIPSLSVSLIKNLKRMNLREIAAEVSHAMLGEDIPDVTLRRIIDGSLNFEIPLIKLDNDLFVLELFHGPTLAFKDVGARFMAALFEYFLEGESRETIILVATSGDTGSAVANAFFKKKGIRVVILYPSGRVSDIQEKQLTTMGGNVIALEVGGNFDDCQRMVREAFSDKKLNEQIALTSANSINFARLFPQSFYYFHAYAQMPEQTGDFAVSVPSGNFGNLTAGIIAKKMGLPVRNFIAGNNSNHPVADYLDTGIFTPHPALRTMSNAMDVGNPSNFPRILEIYERDHKKVTEDIKGFWFDDRKTCLGLTELLDKYDYQADPHGAVAYLALKEYRKEHHIAGVFLETAHPGKFSDEVESATGKKVNIPEPLRKFLSLDKKSVKISNNYQDLKDILISM